MCSLRPNLCGDGGWFEHACQGAMGQGEERDEDVRFDGLDLFLKLRKGGMAFLVAQCWSLGKEADHSWVLGDLSLF